MKLTDERIIKALKEGKRIQNSKEVGESAVLTNYDVLCWIDSHAYAVEPVSLSCIFADDWEVVNDEVNR